MAIDEGHPAAVTAADSFTVGVGGGSLYTPRFMHTVDFSSLGYAGFHLRKEALAADHPVWVLVQQSWESASVRQKVRQKWTVRKVERHFISERNG